jgi:hypothetical protein
MSTVKHNRVEYDKTGITTLTTGSITKNLESGVGARPLAFFHYPYLAYGSFRLCLTPAGSITGFIWFCPSYGRSAILCRPAI